MSPHPSYLFQKLLLSSALSLLPAMILNIEVKAGGGFLEGFFKYHKD